MRVGVIELLVLLGFIRIIRVIRVIRVTRVIRAPIFPHTFPEIRAILPVFP